MGRNGPAFLAYRNFDVYTEWNQSLVYALTAAYYATRLAGAPAVNRGQPVDSLTGAETKELQRLLHARGYDVGKVDGIIGEKTRESVRAIQLKLGMPPDSYPTKALLARLRADG
jgi:peptidoglycan hydrolase-like protein with peptidoglycan-binding domain